MSREMRDKDAEKRKEAAWKHTLGTRDKVAKERCMEVYKQEKRKVKGLIYQSKDEVSENFEKMINQNVDRNRKCF